jgi:hypothetical protein
MAFLGGHLITGFIVTRMRLNVEPGMNRRAGARRVRDSALGPVFAVMPGLHALGPDLVSNLKTSGSATSGSRSERRILSALVAGEIALAMVLLVGAGLLLASLRRLSAVDTGIRTSNLLTFQLGLPDGSTRTPPRRHSSVRQFFSDCFHFLVSPQWAGLTHCP